MVRYGYADPTADVRPWLVATLLARLVQLRSSMGYENAPATILLATHCAVCSRPLVDAESIERGIGPDCAKKHGFGLAQHAPRWQDAASALRYVDVANVGEEIMEHLGAVDASDINPELARGYANRLTHFVACHQDGELVLAAVRAIEALGFVKLAERIASRMGCVRIEEQGDALVVRAPYNPDHVERMRQVPGRRFVRETRGGYDLVPVSSKRALWAALKASFAGRLGVSARGMFVIA